MKSVRYAIFLLALLNLHLLGSVPLRGYCQSAPASNSDQVLERAYRERISKIQIEGRGKVKRLLADDNDGSKHQRFILELGSGQTLLVSHNITLAPRVPGLKLGDLVEFYGEYAWNKQGGVIHWTHRDAEKKHPNGWLKHRGKTYQ